MESVQTIVQERGQCYTVDSNVDALTQQVAGIVEVGQNGPQKPVQNRTTELIVKRMEVVQVTPQERVQYRMMCFADEVDVPMPLGMEDTVDRATEPRGHSGRRADHTRRNTRSTAVHIPVLEEIMEVLQSTPQERVEQTGHPSACKPTHPHEEINPLPSQTLRTERHHDLEPKRLRTFREK